MLASLLLMGTGYGLYLALLGLLACMAGSNRATIGVFCFIFGVPVLGYVADTVGYAYMGGDVIVAIGLLLLLSKFTLHTAILKSPVGLMLIAWTTLVLTFFYFTGPQNSYSLALLLGYLRTTFVTYIAFIVIFSDKTVNWSQLGLLGILSALIYLGAGGRIDPSVLPGSIFDVGSIRIGHTSMDPLARSGALSSHFLAFCAILGFMFIYAKDVSRPKGVKDTAILTVALFTTVVLVGWSGARQGLFMLVAGAGSIFICKFEDKFRRYRIPAMAVGLLLIVFVGIGISKGLAIYAVLFDSKTSFYEKLNRGMVYGQAISQIEERPLLGHGLGGYYYTAKYQRTMKRKKQFAHNVVLDLLVQSGLLGTTAFFIPLLLFRNYRRRFGRMRGKIMGNVILPEFVVMFFKMMIYSQLFDLGFFIGVIAAMDLVRQDVPRRVASVTNVRSTQKIIAPGNGGNWPFTRKRTF